VWGGREKKKGKKGNMGLEPFGVSSSLIPSRTIAGGKRRARPQRTGLDGVLSTTTNTSNLPVEALGDRISPDPDALNELVRGFRRRRPVPRRHGPARVYQAPTNARVRVDIPASARKAGACSAGAPRAGQVEAGPALVFDGDSAVLKAGQWFARGDAGRGGFGPPERRHPMAAARDLARCAISPATAQGVYGVSRRP